MTAAKQAEAGFIRKVMDLVPVAILGLVGWMCLSIIQLKTSVAVMADNVEALLAAKNIADTGNIQENTRRLNKIEEGGSPQSAAPVVAVPVPVTVTNPPSDPVPVEPAPKGKQ